MLELITIAIFGVWTIHCFCAVSQTLCGAIFQRNWTFFTPIAVADLSSFVSPDRSQVRCTLTNLNRLLLGVLLIFVHKMSHDIWLPDAQHDLQLQTVDEIFGVWGEGFSSSMGADGGFAIGLQPSFSLDIDPKLHGPRPMPKQSAVQKRSYYRACRRAVLNGCAWYNGRCIPLREFPMTLISTVTSNMVHASPTAAPVRSHVRGRSRPQQCIQAFLWNSNGLGATRYQELRAWLDNTDCNVVIVPETKWRFENQWEDEHWCFMHSGDPAGALNSSGVLVIVSKTLCRPDNLLWTSVIPGRLMHVRLLGHSRNVDIVACYQAHEAGCNVNVATLTVRSQVFQQLDQLLLSLPQRNLLLVAGDFNCSLRDVPGCCGTQAFRWNGQLCDNVAHSDSSQFEQLLWNHQLVALNTWDGTAGPTFVHTQYNRRIDFFLCRKSSVDQHALNIKQLWDFPMLPLSEYHVPMICSLSRCWKHDFPCSRGFSVDNGIVCGMNIGKLFRST